MRRMVLIAVKPFSPSQRMSASRGGAFDLTAHGRDLQTVASGIGQDGNP